MRRLAPGYFVGLLMIVLAGCGGGASQSSHTGLVTPPTWPEDQGFVDNRMAIAGAKLFAESGCLNCHTYLGRGAENHGAPDLSAIGATNKGANYFARYVANPAAFGDTVMPVYGR